MASTTWYYVENDESIGPLDAAEIERLIDAGTIGPNTAVWTDGMDDWVAAQSQFSFATTRGAPRAAPPNVPQTRGGTGADGLYVGAPARGFGEAISVGFSKYADFSGRASRSEFWYWVLFSMIAGFVTGFMDGLFFPYNDLMPINLIVSLATFLPSLAVGARRLHDINRTGWWQLLPIVNIIFWCQKGDPNSNDYG